MGEAIAAVLLRGLQAVLNDPGMDGAHTEESRANRAVWFLGSGQSTDVGPVLTQYAHALWVGLGIPKFLEYDLPEQLKTDAAQALDMLCGLPLGAGIGVDEDARLFGEVRAGLLGEKNATMFPPRSLTLEETAKVTAMLAGHGREMKMEEIAVQACSRPGCTRRPSAAAGGEGRPVEFRYCARCKIATYCSQECQVAHWKGKGGHGRMCPKGLDAR